MVVPELSLTLSCELHGAAISTRRTDIESSPPSVQIRVDTQPARTATLSRNDLAPLWTVMSGKPLAAFLAETPKDGPRAPGYRLCTLHVRAPTLRAAKSWGSNQVFTPSSAAARAALMNEVTALERRVPR